MWIEKRPVLNGKRRAASVTAATSARACPMASGVTSAIRKGSPTEATTGSWRDVSTAAASRPTHRATTGEGRADHPRVGVAHQVDRHEAGALLEPQGRSQRPAAALGEPRQGEGGADVRMAREGDLVLPGEDPDPRGVGGILG